eukprot:scaffold3143_cov169-Ochromonas_danica.AAC.6
MGEKIDFVCGTGRCDAIRSARQQTHSRCCWQQIAGCGMTGESMDSKIENGSNLRYNANL